MLGAIPVQRGCGFRMEGGVYWEVGLSENGKPLETFILCPPVRISHIVQEGLRVAPQGVSLLERDGVWHVLDWVGSIFYPNVADFLEEARRFGVSRRCELQAEQYAKLTKESRLLTMHSAAWIDHVKPYWGHRLGLEIESSREEANWIYCPLHLEQHQPDKANHDQTMCAGLYWEDVLFCDSPDSERIGRREMPSFSYACGRPPIVSSLEGMTHSLAIFASFPLGRMVVVRDNTAGTHEEKMAKLQGISQDIRVEIVEE